MLNEPMTLREIAEHEGVSHQCVAEVLERALKKMRLALEKRNIKLEDLIDE
jgi:DNA-directed RNA polymerase sigma subunit (sigma70/sigma32)